MMRGNTDQSCLAQLVVLNKHSTSLQITCSDLPIHIGRASDCQMRLKEKGIWDRHVELDLDRDGSFLLRPTSEGSTLINDEPLKEKHKLANGDIIILGDTKLQFFIGPARQRLFDTREALCWMVLMAFVAIQVWLVRWLG